MGVSPPDDQGRPVLAEALLPCWPQAYETYQALRTALCVQPHAAPHSGEKPIKWPRPAKSMKKTEQAEHAAKTRDQSVDWTNYPLRNHAHTGHHSERTPRQCAMSGIACLSVLDSTFVQYEPKVRHRERAHHRQKIWSASLKYSICGRTPDSW